MKARDSRPPANPAQLSRQAPCCARRLLRPPLATPAARCARDRQAAPAPPPPPPPRPSCRAAPSPPPPACRPRRSLRPLLAAPATVRPPTSTAPSLGSLL